jgi:hypothetical protein
MQVEERSMTIKKEDEVMGFINKLKKHFRSASGSASHSEATEAHKQVVA